MARVVYSEEERKRIRETRLSEDAKVSLSILKSGLAAKEDPEYWGVLADCVLNSRRSVACVDEFLAGGNSIESLGLDSTTYEHLVSHFYHLVTIYCLHVLDSGDYNWYPHHHYYDLMTLIDEGKIDLVSYDYTVDDVKVMFRNLLVKDVRKMIKCARDGKGTWVDTFASIRRHYLIEGVTDPNSFCLKLCEKKQFKEFLETA